MKKLLAAVLAFAMVFCFAACGSSEPAETEEATEANPVVGGWEIPADPAAVELPEDVQKAFENFEGNYGDDLIPIAYYGSQVIDETNYGLLCKSKSDNEIQTVILQQRANGNVDGADINTFNIGDYTQGDGAEVSEPAPGGWIIAEDYTKEELPEEVQDAFEKAAAELDGNDLDPMAYLGSQVVAGTNYALLCHSTLVTENPVSSIQVVTVYKDLDGNCSITNICTLDPASFAEE